MDEQTLLRIIAALVSRHTTGVRKLTARELASAPVDALRFNQDRDGDTWVTIGGPTVYRDLDHELSEDER
jgi:hypothetical protein